MEFLNRITPKLKLQDSRKQIEVEEIVKPLIFNLETVKRIRNVFESEIELGLSKNSNGKSCLQMENTFIPELPTGSECGDFLALDLGGTNFRVIMLHLQPIRQAETIVKYYTVPEPLRLGEGEKLFDFLAECIYIFMKDSNILHKHLPLGFCFSFPMVQKALDVGILVTWTKNFNCPSVVGKDAVQMLNDAINRRGDIMVDVVAVVNDTTGTLMKGAYLNEKCAIGLILGTGCNACYLEKVERIEKWEGEHPGISEVIIDTEMGAFGDNGVLDFIKTEFDRAVDEQSLLVRSFTFEKLFAGRYVGELVRRIMLKLTANGLLFDGRFPPTLGTNNSFTASHISDIEESKDSSVTRKVFKSLNQTTLSEDDIAIIQYLCSVTTLRGALLVTICLASLLDRMEKPEAIIAIDGSLYRKHPKLHNLMNECIAEFAPKRKFELMLAEDGSGKGAGIVAAVADRLRSRKS